MSLPAQVGGSAYTSCYSMLLILAHYMEGQGDSNTVSTLADTCYAFPSSCWAWCVGTHRGLPGPWCIAGCCYGMDLWWVGEWSELTLLLSCFKWAVTWTHTHTEIYAGDTALVYDRNYNCYACDDTYLWLVRYSRCGCDAHNYDCSLWGTVSVVLMHTIVVSEDCLCTRCHW